MAKPMMVLTGDKKLNRKLKKLANKEAKKVVREAQRPALKPLLQEARDNAPVKSGELKKNIKIRAIKRSRKGFGTKVSSSDGNNLNSGDAFYGAFLELGVKRKGGSFGSRLLRVVGVGKHRIKPRKYMRNASDKKRKHVMRLYREKIASGLKELARNG